jgi:hypothetical protein
VCVCVCVRASSSLFNITLFSPHFSSSSTCQRSETGDYIGRDNADILLVLELSNNPGPGQPLSGSEDGNSSDFWHDLPEWARIAILVAGACLILLLILCIVCCCLYGFCGRREKCERPQKEKQTRDTTVLVVLDPEAGSHPRSPPRKTSQVLENTERAEDDSNPFLDTSEGAYDDGDDEEDSHVDDEDEEVEDDEDVYFDSEDQPGTKAFRQALQRTVAVYGDEDYSPEVYRHLKKQLPGRTFMIYDYHDEDEDVEGEWRQMEKKELIKRFKKEFNKEKRRLEKEEK